MKSKHKHTHTHTHTHNLHIFTYIYIFSPYIYIYNWWIYIYILNYHENVEYFWYVQYVLCSFPSNHANLFQTLVHTHNRTHYGVDGLVPVWLGAQLWRLAFPRWVVAPPPPSVLWCSWLLESSTGQGSATDHYLALRPWGSGRGHKQQALICVLADCTSNVQQCANKNKLLGALAAAPCWAGWVTMWLDWVSAESN